jgi:hypothetical protein
MPLALGVASSSLAGDFGVRRLSLRADVLARRIPVTVGLHPHHLHVDQKHSVGSPSALAIRGTSRQTQGDLKSDPVVLVALEASAGAVEIVSQGYLQISFLQPLREHQRSKGISRSKTLIVIV